MSRHATSAVADPTPMAPVRLDVIWPAIVARGDLGASTNALVDGGGAPPAGTAAAAGPPLRHLRLVGVVEAVAGDPDLVRFSLHLEEAGHRTAIGPHGELPGSVAYVGDHLHIVVDDPANTNGPPLLTVVTDDAHRPLLVRSRLAALAGLPPGAAGRPSVSLACVAGCPVAVPRGLRPG